MEFKFEFSLLEVICFLWETFLEFCAGVVITSVICVFTDIDIATWYGCIMVILASVIVGTFSDFIANAVEEDDNEDGE